MSNCYSCGKEFPAGLGVYRTTECSFCGKDVKVCLNCEFYSQGSHLDCRENISEPVIDKDKANFCDFFKLADNSLNGKSNCKASEKAAKARSAFENLFADE